MCVIKIMNRYFIHFCFDGSKYHGWQIQPNSNTVQNELQKALTILLRNNIEVVGAGRTDAGVHARKMVAHFDFETELDLDQLSYRLNRLLPSDIAVSRVEKVQNNVHARFSAVNRTYHYYIHTAKNPFLKTFSCELHYKLDFDLMNEAAQHLLQINDFGAFCKSHSDVKNTLCNVYYARWIKKSNSSWYFKITANRFLRNMVRAIVGTLIEVGRGKMNIAEFDKVISGKKRTEAGESMPGNALFLEDVEY